MELNRSKEEKGIVMGIKTIDDNLLLMDKSNKTDNPLMNISQTNTNKNDNILQPNPTIKYITFIFYLFLFNLFILTYRSSHSTEK